MKKFIKAFAVLTMIIVLSTSCQQQAKKTMGSAKDGNEQKIEDVSMKLVKSVSDGGYKLVSTEELQSWIDAKKDMVIIDTMPKKSFDKNRIPGAVNAELPIKMEDVTPEQKEAFIKALGENKSKTIVLYCGFVKCERSHVGAILAKEQGFTEVYRQPGGIVAWMDAGNKIEGSAAK